MIKINDIIQTTNNKECCKKRYELSQTKHINVEQIVEDINSIISILYKNVINIHNMAAIAKKRSQYQNTKHKKEKESNKSKTT